MLYACGGGSNDVAAPASNTSEQTNHQEKSLDNNAIVEEVSTIALSTKIRSVAITDPHNNEKWLNAINQYSFEKFATGSYDDNFLISSYQQQSLFAPMYLAAQELTAEQIGTKFYYDNLPIADDRLQFLLAFNSIDLNLTATQAFSNNSKIWGQVDYAFSADFIDLAVEYIGLELQANDFQADKSIIVSNINSWFSENNGDYLTTIFPESTITVNTKIVLTNSTNFNGRWLTPFVVDAELGEFLLLDESSIEVPVMTATLDVQYFSDGNETIVELPFSDQDWSLYIISSNDVTDHQQLKNLLNEDKFTELRAATTLTSIELTLPQFAFQHTSYFVDGISTSYDEEGANFANVNKEQFADLYVTELEAKHAINFNEQGLQLPVNAYLIVDKKPIPEPEVISGNITAGHVSHQGNMTGSICIIGFSCEEEIEIVRINGPMFYFLYHKPTGTIVFSGNLIDPISE